MSDPTAPNSTDIDARISALKKEEEELEMAEADLSSSSSTSDSAPAASSATAATSSAPAATQSFEAWAIAKKTPIHVVAGAAVYAGWAAQRQVTEASYDAAIKTFLGLSMGGRPVTNPSATTPPVDIFAQHYVGAPARQKHGVKTSNKPSPNPQVRGAQLATAKASAQRRWSAMKGKPSVTVQPASSASKTPAK